MGYRININANPADCSSCSNRITINDVNECQSKIEETGETNVWLTPAEGKPYWCPLDAED